MGVIVFKTDKVTVNRRSKPSPTKESRSVADAFSEFYW